MRLIIYTFIFSFVHSYLYSQGCLSTSQWPTAAVNPTTTWTTIALDNWAGDYAVVNVVNGTLYEFSTCSTNGSNVTYDSELTLTTSTNTILVYSDDYCGSQSYISWVATFTGTVRIHLSEWPCLTNLINSSIRVRSGTPPAAPANNNCANATTLTPSSTCNLVSGTTLGATEDPYIDPSCDPGIINDVWYTFNSGANTSLNLTVNLGTASWIGVEFFTGCGTQANGLSLGGNAGNCDFNTNVPNPTVISGLTTNTTYRMRLFTNVSYDIAGSFTTCLTTPPPPTVSVNSTSVCAGQSVTLTATPSTSGGTYLWSNGAITQSITVNPTVTTNYSVTYTNNGTANGTGTVTVNALPTINAGQDVTICQGASTNLNATGGTTYVWTSGPSTATYTVSPSLTTTYTVTGTDLNGCSNSDQVVVNVNALPVVNSISSQSLCAGATTTAVTFSGTAGASYSWTNNLPSIGLAATGNGNIPSFIATNSTANTVTATITVTPTYLGCTGNAQTFTYTINPTPLVIPLLNQTVCSGSSTNVIVFSGTAGSTFNWTNSNSNIGLASSGTGDINSFTSINSTSSPITSLITVTPVIGNCLGQPQSFSFTVNPTPSITGNAVLCPSTSSQLVGSGSPASNNAWISNNSSIATVSNTGLVGAVSFGTTIITYTSNLGCSVNTTINVTNPTTPTFNPINSVCSGGTIQLPTTSTNNITGTWSPSVNNTQTTTYTFLPTNGQCATTTQLTVTVNPNPTISGGNNVCLGSTLQLTGSGTPSSSSPWSSGNLSIGSVSNTGLVTGVAAGNSAITYTDFLGCFSTLNITVNSNPTANAGQDITVCLGGNATLNGSATGGVAPYTYNWNNGVQNGVSFSINSTNSYILTVTDALNCSSTDVITINTSSIDWANLQWPASGDMCLGQTHTVYGQLYIAGITNGAGPASGIIAQVGVSPVNTDPSTWTSASWSNATFNTQVGNNDEYIAGIGQLLSAGTYYYTFRYSLGQGCPFYYSGYNAGSWDGITNNNGTLIINNAPNATTTISACGSYVWQGQTYTQSGTYVQTVLSGTSCDSVLYLNLTIHNPIVGSEIQASACNSYFWNGQDYTQSGTYTYTGTSQYGCDSTVTLVLTINQAPSNTSVLAQGGTLTVTSQNAISYEWLDCSTNSVVPGETDLSFTSQVTGEFAAIAQNNCGSDTSNCILLEVQGINDLEDLQLVIHPNPTSGEFSILSENFKVTFIQVFDLNGKLLFEELKNSSILQIDISEYMNGVYIVKVFNSDNFYKSLRIVKN
jgi:hypothetical protein